MQPLRIIGQRSITGKPEFHRILYRRPFKTAQRSLSYSSSLHDRVSLMSRGRAFQERLLSRQVLRFSESDMRKRRELSTSECCGFGGQQGSTGTFYQAILVSKDEHRDAVGRRKQMAENLIAQCSQQEAVDKLWLPHLVFEEALRNLSIGFSS
jgi:hypothetical protein